MSESPPQGSPLTEHERNFVYESTRLSEQVLQKVWAVADDDQVAQVLIIFSQRLTHSLNSLLILRRYARHDYAPDGETLLRAMFDAMLQGLYVMENEERAAERSQLFLDYYWVEKHQLLQKIDANSTSLAQRLAKSPRREMGEPTIKAEFARVRHQFLTKKGKRLRASWYPGTLRDLAQSADCEPEYEMLHQSLSGMTHTGPFAASHGANIKGEHLSSWGLHMIFRYIGGLASFYSVDLDHEEQVVVDAGKRSMLNDP